MIPTLLLLLTGLVPAPPGCSPRDQESLDRTAKKVLEDVPPPPLKAGVEGPAWTGSMSLGASRVVSPGGRQVFTASISGTRRGERDRVRLSGFWHYADQEDTTGDRQMTQRRYGGTGQYDYFFAPKDYFLVNTGSERDLKSALDLRVTSGVGYGRQFKEGEHWTIAAELGGGWFYEDFAGAEPDQEGAARLGYNWRWRGEGPLSLEQRGEVFPSLAYADDVRSRLESQLRYDLSGALFTKLEWRHEWDNLPARDRVRIDQYLLLAIGMKF